MEDVKGFGAQQMHQARGGQLGFDGQLDERAKRGQSGAHLIQLGGDCGGIIDDHPG